MQALTRSCANILHLEPLVTENQSKSLNTYMLLPAPLALHKFTPAMIANKQTSSQDIGLIITFQKQFNQLDFYIFGSQHYAIVF